MMTTEGDTIWGDVDDSDWGDDEELNLLLVQATQAAEQDYSKESVSQTQRAQTKTQAQVQAPKNVTNRARAVPAPAPSGTAGDGVTEGVARQLLATRRNHLEPIGSSSRSPTQQTESNGGSGSDWKTKYEELKSKHQTTVGENKLIRKQYEITKEELQRTQLQFMRKENLVKQKFETELVEKQKQLKEKESELRLKNQEIFLLRANAPMANFNQKRSIGGAHPLNRTSPGLSQQRPEPQAKLGSQPVRIQAQMYQTKPVTNSPTIASSFSTAPKHSSDPNLNVPIHKPPPPSPPVPKKVYKTNATQTSAYHEQRQRDKLIFTKDGINFIELESISSLKETSVRKDIFLRLESIIKLEFKQVEPILSKVVDLIRSEITSKFVVGIKSYKNLRFPDVVERVFEYCRDEDLRALAEKRKGDRIDFDPPFVPNKHNPSIVNMDKCMEVVEDNFVLDGACLALHEIKEALMSMLGAMIGKTRFCLFETKNMHAFWTLLSWAKHLWKLLVFEEQLGDDELNIMMERDKRLEDLKEWTGLILKADWRDLLFDELEEIIRGLSLEIIESIFASGYFEHIQRRYEILYLIIKDTLLNERMRNEKLIRRCLSVVKWAVADKSIFHYLCFDRNDGHCLAQLFGDNVLRCFQKTVDPSKKAGLLAHYLQLLTVLMMKNPGKKVRKWQGQSRRTSQEFSLDLDEDSFSDSDDDAAEKKKTPDPDSDDNPWTTTSMEVDKELLYAEDDDQIFSQFACEDRYKFEEGFQERAKVFHKVKTVPCWIKPKHWEMPMEPPEDEPPKDLCQCRKFLLGNAFIMLNQIVSHWRNAYLRAHKIMDDTEMSELDQLVELSTLGEDKDKRDDGSGSVINAKRKALRTKSENLRKFISTKLDQQSRYYSVQKYDMVRDWTWEHLILTSDLGKNENGWLVEKQRKPNMLDYILRRSVFFICFAYQHSKNLALALSSPGYGNIEMLRDSLKFFMDEIDLTEFEREQIKDLEEEDEEEEEEEINQEKEINQEEETEFVFKDVKERVNDDDGNYKTDFAGNKISDSDDDDMILEDADAIVKGLICLPLDTLRLYTDPDSESYLEEIIFPEAPDVLDCDLDEILEESELYSNQLLAQSESIEQAVDDDDYDIEADNYI